MRVLWTPEAEQDRDDIWTHIAADNLPAAKRMDLLFSEVAAKLEAFPMLGQVGKITGTRELIAHGHYRLVYQITAPEQQVWVLALIHTAQQWPPVA